jgi:acetyl esterase/lipase
VVHGTSAGGNLAAALVLRCRAFGIPFPAGLILWSPELDLTESGDSFAVLTGVDVAWAIARESLLVQFSATGL